MKVGASVKRIPVLIEAGHIYLDEAWSEEHARGMLIGKSLLNEDSALCVFVDDVNVLERKWTKDQIVTKLSTYDVSFVGFEGSLRRVTDVLMSTLMNVSVEKFKGKTVYVYDDGERRFGLREVSYDGVTRDYCVLLSTAWALCKLGVFDYADVFDLTGVTVGDRIATVLPRRFEKVESNVMYLVECLYGRGYANRMSYVFFD